MSIKTWLYFSLASAIALFGYTNCGRVGKAGLITSSSVDTLSSKTVCFEDLMAQYNRTYFPFLKENCASCHSAAHGSSDITVSYQYFRDYSSRKVGAVTLIDYQATHAHGGNSLGPQMQPVIDGFSPDWIAAERVYSSCQSSVDKEPTEPTKTTLDIALSLKPILKIEDTRTNNTLWIPISWQTASETAEGDNINVFASTFTIEARYLIMDERVVGFLFRNPQVQLAVGQKPVNIKGLSLVVEDLPITQFTTYSNLEKNVTDTTLTNLSPGAGSAIAYVGNLTASARISFILNDIKDPIVMPVDPGPVVDPNQPPPVTPTMVTLAELLGTDAVKGVFGRNCVGCHNANNMSGSFNITDPVAAKAKASVIISRMKDTANPMPKSGVLSGSQVDVVQVWINNGTP